MTGAVIDIKEYANYNYLKVRLGNGEVVTVGVASSKGVSRIGSNVQLVKLQVLPNSQIEWAYYFSSYEN